MHKDSQQTHRNSSTHIMYLQHPQKYPINQNVKCYLARHRFMRNISSEVSWLGLLHDMYVEGYKQYFCGINFAINNFYCYYLAHNKNVEVGSKGKELISIESDTSTCQNLNLTFFYSNFNRSQSTSLLERKNCHNL